MDTNLHHRKPKAKFPRYIQSAAAMTSTSTLTALDHHRAKFSIYPDPITFSDSDPTVAPSNITEPPTTKSLRSRSSTSLREKQQRIWNDDERGRLKHSTNFPKCLICNHAVHPKEGILLRPCLHGPIHKSCIEAEERLYMAAATATCRQQAPLLYCPLCHHSVNCIVYNLQEEIPSTRLPFSTLNPDSTPSSSSSCTSLPNASAPPYDEQYEEYEELAKAIGSTIINESSKSNVKHHNEKSNRHTNQNSGPSENHDPCAHRKVSVDINVIHHYKNCENHKHGKCDRCCHHSKNSNKYEAVPNVRRSKCTTRRRR